MGSSESAHTTVENHILDLPTWSRGWGWSGCFGASKQFAPVPTLRSPQEWARQLSNPLAVKRGWRAASDLALGAAAARVPWQAPASPLCTLLIEALGGHLQGRDRSRMGQPIA